MRYLSIIVLVLFSVVAQSQQQYKIASPSNKMMLQVQIEAGSFSYAVDLNKKHVVLPSTLGIAFSKPQLTLDHFVLLGIDSSNFNQSWKPVWGEEDVIQDRHTQWVFHLIDKVGSGIKLDISFKIFDEGVAFQYAFPEQANLKHFVVSNELSHFTMAGNHKTFWIPGDYDTNEFTYNTTKLSDVDGFAAAAKEKDIAVVSPISTYAVQTPLMMKDEQGLYINIHEAALLNYPAMNLELDKSTRTFSAALVPDAVGNKAYLQTPAKTPWRTIIASEDAAGILSSRMILNLNEPSAVANTSWIKPQKFVGVWWEMHTGKATWQYEGGKHGANTTNVKRYIDFASKHHFDGVLVEGWNKGWEDWFGNWKEDVFDFVTPYPDYDIKQLTAYAKQKGVKLIMHHETSGAVTNYERRMDTAYKFMLNNGINTLKTGYVGKIIPRGEHHDGQWMVNHYQRVAAKTASYHIMLDAHEPVHPTGLHRTYPNWMANEAARGAEFNNAPTLGILPEHNTILPFTRLMGGPMDYTPGLFHFQLNQFEKDRKQIVRSTLAKQLALYVTMYSPLQMAADLPENYEKHLDAFQFIKDVPVNWSETIILEAEPGDYLTIARRKKNSSDWYVGSITDEHERRMHLSLNFLEAGKKYLAILYKDGEHAHYLNDPENYAIEKKYVDASSVLDVPIAPGGGCAISITRLK